MKILTFDVQFFIFSDCIKNHSPPPWAVLDTPNQFTNIICFWSRSISGLEFKNCWTIAGVDYKVLKSNYLSHSEDLRLLTSKMEGLLRDYRSVLVKVRQGKKDQNINVIQALNYTDALLAGCWYFSTDLLVYPILGAGGRSHQPSHGEPEEPAPHHPGEHDLKPGVQEPQAVLGLGHVLGA